MNNCILNLEQIYFRNTRLAPSGLINVNTEHLSQRRHVASPNKLEEKRPDSNSRI